MVLGSMMRSFRPRAGSGWPFLRRGGEKSLASLASPASKAENPAQLNPRKGLEGQLLKA